MTHDETLVEMEKDFNLMTDKEKDTILFFQDGKDWSPKLLLEEVRNKTEMGLSFAKQWASNHEAVQALANMLGISVEELMSDPTQAHQHGPDCKHDDELVN